MTGRWAGSPVAVYARVMPRAQNKRAKGSIWRKTKRFAHLGMINLCMCVGYKWRTALTKHNCCSRAKAALCADLYNFFKWKNRKRMDRKKINYRCSKKWQLLGARETLFPADQCDYIPPLYLYITAKTNRISAVLKIKKNRRRRQIHQYSTKNKEKQTEKANTTILN